MILSKKQIQLFNDITKPNIPKISVLGSTQSGKTHCIDFSIIEYSKNLYNYEMECRKDENYIPRDYYGAIIGWTTDTIKSNIVDPLEKVLEKEYHFKNGKDYVLKYGQNEKYFEIYGIKYYFFGFNTNLSFNRILGKPLIFVWVDEAARIYTSSQLRSSFDELPGRQMSYSGHPFYKTIHSFNVEGSQNHPYKLKYIDNWEAIKYTFFPYDNPVLDTEEKIKEAVKAFPVGSLREQKVFCKWVIASGKVFNKINKLTRDEFKDKYIIREIGIGCDYGSVNPTTFIPIALAMEKDTRIWRIIILPEKYYHNPKDEGDTPTTEYYSNQLRMFLDYLHKEYTGIPINTLVIDSEASHFDNRLKVDNIRHELAKKNKISVDESVQYMQSLFYKEYLYIVEENTIKYFTNDGIPIYSGHDIALDELESYHYDNVKSEKEGINTYVKDFDHAVDGVRYIIMEFQLTNRAPVV